MELGGDYFLSPNDVLVTAPYDDPPTDANISGSNSNRNAKGGKRPKSHAIDTDEFRSQTSAATSAGTSFPSGYEGTTNYGSQVDAMDTAASHVDNRSTISEGYPGSQSAIGDDASSGDTELIFGHNYRRYLSGGKWLNRCLGLWHFIILLMSLLFMVSGIGLRFFFGYVVILQVQALPMYATYTKFIKEVSEDTEIYFSGYVQIIGSMLIALHAVYGFCVMGYMTYGTHKFRFILPISTMLTGFMSFAEITITNVMLAPAFTKDVQEELRKQAQREYQMQSDNRFSVALDYISIWLKCCGITDRYDFQTIDLVYRSQTSELEYHDIQFAFPPTCCKRHLFATNKNQVMGCASDAQRYYENGCFLTLFSYIKMGSEYYTVIIWIHLADVFLHAVLYRRRITNFYRSLDYKSDRQEAYMRYLLKVRLKQEADLMKKLFGEPKAKRYSTISEKMRRQISFVNLDY